jgi:hypothetical protein
LCQSFMFYYNTFFKFLIHHNCLLGHQLWLVLKYCVFVLQPLF